MTSEKIKIAKDKLQESKPINNKLFRLCMHKIQSHSRPIALSYALSELIKHKLLTLSNINTLENYNNPQAISSALAAIPKTLATQENLNQLFNLKKDEFLEHSGYLLYRIPENLFTQNVFDEIITLSQKPNPIREISQYIDQLLEANNRNPIYSTLFTSATKKLEEDNNFTHSLTLH